MFYRAYRTYYNVIMNHNNVIAIIKYITTLRSSGAMRERSKFKLYLYNCEYQSKFITNRIVLDCMNDELLVFIIIPCIVHTLFFCAKKDVYFYYYLSRRFLIFKCFLHKPKL